MPASRKPTMRGRRLGTALKRYRLAAKLDQEHAAEALACSTAKISRIESGINSARVAEVRYLLDLYDVEDPKTRGQLEGLARESNKRGWWLDYGITDRMGDYIALETDATFIRTWHSVLIPGLMQTADYTRALAEGNPANADPEAIDQVVKTRQARRRKFEESAPHYAAVIWEPALTSPMPFHKAHREQLKELLLDTRRPNLTLQVLPVTEWVAARSSPAFTMLSFDGEWSPSAVAQDTHTNVVVLEDEEVIAAYGHTFDALRSAALTPTETRSFIQKVLADIPEEDERT
jgi:transcriptional regulator with XRE-family HTH domain